MMLVLTYCRARRIQPTAAALSYGLDVSDADKEKQNVLIFDLGGGTLDLAIVSYSSDEVRVVSSDGDLELGGLVWTQTLVDLAAQKFIEDFESDPRTNPERH